LLFESHAGLQYQYNVSCTELDFLVEKAKESRVVVGARMMGGGFGGCTINLVETNKLEKFKDQITTKYNQKFNTTCSFYNVKLSEGTTLIS
jgi:galactokinase